MRVSFSRAKEFVPEWNGNKTLPEKEQLKFVLSPMDNGDFFDAQDVIGRLGIKSDGKGGVDASEANAESQRELMTSMTTYLNRYVKSTGAPLLDQNDQPLTIEDIGQHAALCPLAMELLLEVIQRGVPSAVEIKN